MAGFNEGDRVAWHHLVAPLHSLRSVPFASSIPAVPEGADVPDGHQGWLGTVQGSANDEGTWLNVKFDNGEEKVLTQDELVLVDEDG